VLFSLLLLLPASVVAWWDIGHILTAEIARRGLEPTKRAQLDALLALEVFLIPDRFIINSFAVDREDSIHTRARLPTPLFGWMTSSPAQVRLEIGITSIGHFATAPFLKRIAQRPMVRVIVLLPCLKKQCRGPERYYFDSVGFHE